ncbi:MAG: flagellar basal-body rod protein FlgF [Planctomycetota bacterium]
MLAGWGSNLERKGHLGRPATFFGRSLHLASRLLTIRRMNLGLYRGVAALTVAEKSMDSISSNLAGMRTPGFKRRSSANHAFHVGRFGSNEMAVKAAEHNDFSQGDLSSDGNQLDLALKGDGFFEVEGPSGPLYTRDGEFRMERDGRLVTPEGHPVAWDRKASQLDPSGEVIGVDHFGVVSQGGRTVGTLKVVAFADQEALRHSQDGYFVADPRAERTASTAQVRQFSLEQSNVNPVEELVALITVQRTHERAAAIVSQIDQSYRRLTSSR